MIISLRQRRKVIKFFEITLIVAVILNMSMVGIFMNVHNTMATSDIGPDSDETQRIVNVFDEEACREDGACDGCPDTDADDVCDVSDSCIDVDKDEYGLGEQCRGVDCDDSNSLLNVDCSGGKTEEPVMKKVKINAFKVVCESEVYLPNWGQGVDLPSVITETTATDYVTETNAKIKRDVCWVEKDWYFQWGFGDKEGLEGVDKVGDGAHIGPADGTPSTGKCGQPYCGPNTNTGADYNQWKTFGPTDAMGKTSVLIEDTSEANALWVREILQDKYIPYTYPPEGPRDNDVSAELYCETDILNYDNYDNIINIEDEAVYNCIAFNAPKRVKINAHKVVCESEIYLPNWGQVELIPDEPARIQFDTAENYVTKINTLNKREVCWLEKDWQFQWGYNHTGEGEGNADGVHKLPGNQVGPADGTDTTGQCYQQYCGPNTFTGTEHQDWKTMTGMTNDNGVISLIMEEADLVAETGIWLREVLKEGYIPYTYPPDGPRQNEISAEFYCEDDIVNYDNYDIIKNPKASGIYNCIAFNAPKRVKINAHKVVCESEIYLPNWGQVELIPEEPARIQFDTAENYVNNINNLNERRVCWLDKDWQFQWGYNHAGDSQGVHKLPGNHVGPADGTDTSGQCDSQYCGPNTSTGTEHKDWKTLAGMTNSNGLVSLTLEENSLVNETGIWLREVLKEDYIPYTYPPDGPRENEVSAEFYCEDDIVNYDNYDIIRNPIASGIYNCIAFNAPKKCENKVEGYKTNHFTREGLEGWVIELYNMRGVLKATTTTLKGGYYSFENVCDGDYKIMERAQTAWTQVLPIDETGKDYYSISLPEKPAIFLKSAYILTNGPETTYYNFANKPMLCGHKYDAGNNNIGIEGWNISISEYVEEDCEDETCPTGLNLLGTATTDQNGLYCFELDRLGTYQAKEERRDAWFVQGPDNYDNIFNGTAPLMIDFYNYQERSISRSSSGGGEVPLNITAEKVTCLDEDSVEFTWNTNKYANQRVVFGPNSNPGGTKENDFGYPNTSVVSEDKTSSHRVVIDGLSLATYYFSPVSDGLKGQELSLDMNTCQKISLTEEPVLVLGEMGESKLEISKVSNKDFANPGDEIEFTITVKNIGNMIAYKVVLKDVLPKELNFVEFSGEEKSWDLGDIEAGASKTIVVKTKVDEKAKAGEYTNFAIATSDSEPRGVEAKDKYLVEEVSVLAATGLKLQEILLLLIGLLVIQGTVTILKRRLS